MFTIPSFLPPLITYPLAIVGVIILLFVGLGAVTDWRRFVIRGFWNSHKKRAPPKRGL